MVLAVADCEAIIQTCRRRRHPGFRSGALGVFEATVATRPDNLEGSLSLLGEKGAAVIAGVAVNATQTWTFTEQHEHEANSWSRPRR